MSCVQEKNPASPSPPAGKKTSPNSISAPLITLCLTWTADEVAGSGDDVAWASFLPCTRKKRKVTVIGKVTVTVPADVRHHCPPLALGDVGYER